MLGICSNGEKFLYLGQFSLMPFSEEQGQLEKKKKSVKKDISFFINKSSEGGVLNLIQS